MKFLFWDGSVVSNLLLQLKFEASFLQMKLCYGNSSFLANISSFPRRLQRNNFSSSKTSSRRVMQDVFQRNLEDVLITFCKTNKYYAEGVFDKVSTRLHQDEFFLGFHNVIPIPVSSLVTRIDASFSEWKLLSNLLQQFKYNPSFATREKIKSEASFPNCYYNSNSKLHFPNRNFVSGIRTPFQELKLFS